jgi:hypothetical protein
MALRDDLSKRFFDSVPWCWVDVEDLFADISPTIPPGKALRQYARTKATASRNTDPSQLTHPERSVPRPLTQDQQIRSGKRNMLNEIIDRLYTQGYIEKRKVDGARQVRRKESRVNPHRVAAADDLVAAVEKYLSKPLFAGMVTAEERMLQDALDDYKAVMDDD